MEIPNEIIERYKKAGYTKKQIEEAYLNALKQKEREEIISEFSDSKTTINENELSSSAFESTQSEDLIKFQLELNSILEKIEHMLRGDVITFKNGNRYYMKDKTKKMSLLNEYGVQLVMNILTNYLNRNTILANLKEDEIYQSIENFGKELADLFYMKYEQMGLDTAQKRQTFTMMITELVDIVRLAYSRAKNGLERISLREARQVTQSQQLLPDGYIYPSSKNKGLLHPQSWFGGH